MGGTKKSTQKSEQEDCRIKQVLLLRAALEGIVAESSLHALSNIRERAKAALRDHDKMLKDCPQK